MADVSCRYLALAFLLIYALAWAEQTPSTAQQGLLVQLAQRSAAYENISGLFRQQRRIAQLPMALKSSGEFSYSSESGVIWQTLQPIESAVRINRQGLSLQGQTPQLNSALMARLILNVFTGDIEALKPYFNANAEGNLHAWTVTLSPQNAQVASQFQAIVIRGAEFTEVIEILEPAGDSTVIELIEVDWQARTDELDEE